MTIAPPLSAGLMTIHWLFFSDTSADVSFSVMFGLELVGSVVFPKSSVIRLINVSRLCDFPLGGVQPLLLRNGSGGCDW